MIENLKRNMTPANADDAALDLLQNIPPEDEESARERVRILCETAAHPDEAIAAAGQRALFPGLIERLNDSFDPAACAFYDRIAAQMIDFFRRLPEARSLDRALSRFGIETESDLLIRKSQLSTLTSQTSNLNSRIRKILLLSRVTIGADVTITSVIIAALRRAIPDAEFVLLGGPKLRELYGGDERLRIHEINYGRGARVLSRLMSWLDVIDAVEEETRGLSPEEVLVIDPDSRLTQLGLLPVTPGDRNYYFFESRSYRREEAERLGELTARWVNETFGLRETPLPFVSLDRDRLEFGRRIAQSLRQSGASKVVTVSLGVGGNEKKRISEAFERELVQLISQRAALVLDAGATPEEHKQAAELVAMLEKEGRGVMRLDERTLDQDLRFASAATWRGGVGEFAGLIAASDLYLGYDSAGQHIAAALGVPTITIFVASNGPVFARRWRPCGPGPVEVIALTTETAAVSAQEILDRIKHRLLDSA